jgi:hypothetical protein
VTELRPSGDPLIYRNHINGDRGLPPPAPPVSTFKSMYHNEPKRPSSGLIRQVREGIMGTRFGRDWGGGASVWRSVWFFQLSEEGKKKSVNVCVCVRERERERDGRQVSIPNTSPEP